MMFKNNSLYFLSCWHNSCNSELRILNRSFIMLAKQLVILANSNKHGNRCVAGKCLSTGQWIRPVSTIGGGALSLNQIRCRNPHGLFPATNLQRVIVGLDCHAPLVNQPENHLIAANSEWQQNFKINAIQLPQLLDNPISLWGEGNSVSYAAIQQNKIRINQSLFLVQTKSLSFYTSDHGKPRAIFSYKNVSYDLPVSDPNYSAIVRDKRDLKGILCISLGEDFNGSCYKLVASIY